MPPASIILLSLRLLLVLFVSDELLVPATSKALGSEATVRSSVIYSTFFSSRSALSKKFLTVPKYVGRVGG